MALTLNPSCGDHNFNFHSVSSQGSNHQNERCRLYKAELINGTTPKPGSNISLIADVSVKNPNVASFKYRNITTNLYYYGTVVGDARGPTGRAKAHRIMRMNIMLTLSRIGSWPVQIWLRM